MGGDRHTSMPRDGRPRLLVAVPHRRPQSLPSLCSSDVLPFAHSHRPARKSGYVCSFTNLARVPDGVASSHRKTVRGWKEEATDGHGRMNVLGCAGEGCVRCKSRPEALEMCGSSLSPAGGMK